MFADLTKIPGVTFFVISSIAAIILLILVRCIFRSKVVVNEAQRQIDQLAEGKVNLATQHERLATLKAEVSRTQKQIQTLKQELDTQTRERVTALEQMIVKKNAELEKQYSNLEADRATKYKQKLESSELEFDTKIQALQQQKNRIEADLNSKKDDLNNITTMLQQTQASFEKVEALREKAQIRLDIINSFKNGK